MNVKYWLTTLLLWGALNLHGNEIDLSAPIPLNPKVQKGVLENGMTYYVLSNKEPKGMASFYIAQNVGAMQEEDDQNGLAHFLEHMAFNGTKNFPGKAIIDGLEKHGVVFGRDINAYTSHDETVYNISNVPVLGEKEKLIDTCLLILHDWSSSLLLEEDEIDAERGVIQEEWRTRNTVSTRMRKQAMQYYAKDSKYAKRDVMGDMDIVRTFEYQTLRDYYEKWYRPDLQCIIAVGDFDADEVVGKIKELFGKIPAAVNPAEREYFSIPENKEPIYAQLTDPELTVNTILIAIKHKEDENKEVQGYLRNNMLSSFYNGMLSNRISELLQKENPPFISGNSGYGGFIGRDSKAYSLSVNAGNNKEEQALRAILEETERVKRHGFTAEELERMKKNTLRSSESYYKQREKISHDSYAKSFSSHYLKALPFTSADFSYKFAQEVIPTIKLEELNALAKKWLVKDNLILMVQGVDKEGIKHLTEKEILAIWDEVENSEIASYQDNLAGASLFDEKLKAGTLKKEKYNAALKTHEWTLSNGVRVYYRYSDLNKDQLMMTATSEGGTSLYGVDKLASAQIAGSWMGNYGVGDFNKVELGKMLAGKKVGVSPFIGELTEGFSGNAAPEDLETLLQLTYLYFEKPRFDEAAHAAMEERYRTFLQNQEGTPQKIKSDSTMLIGSNYSERTLLMDETYFDQVDLKQIEEIYRERIQDASDFQFFFIGDLKAEAARPLIVKYLGALTDVEREETYVEHKMGMPQGVTQKYIGLNQETTKSSVSVSYSNTDVKYSLKDSFSVSILGKILKIRYQESVREEEGGTYGVRAGSKLRKHPSPDLSVFISFDCDPEKTRDLLPIIYNEIEKIQNQGPLQVDLDKVIESMRKDREKALEHNNIYFSAMQSYYQEDGFNPLEAKNFDKILEKIKPADIQRVANYLTEANRLELVFYTEKE